MSLQLFFLCGCFAVICILLTHSTAFRHSLAAVANVYCIIDTVDRANDWFVHEETTQKDEC